MIERRKISKAKRALIWMRDGGVCWLCKEKITDPEWHLEHRVPLENGGDDTDENLSPAHILCHKPKTRREAADRAKRNRVGKEKKPSRPIPGSKRSGVKCRLTSDGPKWERR